MLKAHQDLPFLLHFASGKWSFICCFQKGQAWFYHPRTAHSSKGENSLPDFVSPPLCSLQVGSGVMSPEPAWSRDVEDESAPGTFVGRICSSGEVVGINGEIQNLNY